jgi:hypothetical protein
VPLFSYTLVIFYCRSRDEVDDSYREGSDLSARNSSGALIAMQHSTAPGLDTTSRSTRTSLVSKEFSYNPISAQDDALQGKQAVAVIESGSNDLRGLSVESAASPRVIPVEERYTHKEIIKIAAIVSPIWFGANCLYNYSLLETSVGSSTIIRQVSRDASS